MIIRRVRAVHLVFTLYGKCLVRTWGWRRQYCGMVNFMGWFKSEMDTTFNQDSRRVRRGAGVQDQAYSIVIGGL
ncbi:hypothetical protein BJX76DRAFT_327850 [Aspergillus varians]